MNADALIIGGGVIGLSIARELYKRGERRITIVDQGGIGRESSWAAAGMLAPNIETDATEDFHRFGLESLALYPDLSNELLDETGIDIELDRSGTLCLAFDENEAAGLGETLAQRLSCGVPAERLSADEALRREPSLGPALHEALFFPNDWQVENRKLVSALRRFAEENRMRIVENAGVSELLTAGSRIVGARTPAEDLNAGTTILATGAWTSLIKIDGVRVPVDVRPVRGQMISFDAGERFLRHVIYSPRGYVVPRTSGRVLIGATVEDAGFDKSTTPEGIDTLKAAAVEIVPCLGDLEILEHWAGLRPYAADGLPVIGRVPGYQNVFVATAHYRNGILLAPKTAEIIADGIMNDTGSRFFELYSAGRFAGTANASAIC